MARILLAEDDAATRDMVQRALAMDGHEVVVTQDGAEALEKLQAAPGRFDLLISDVQMPGVDGVGAGREGPGGGTQAARGPDVGLRRRARPRRSPQGQDLPHHHQALHARADPRRGEGGAGLAASHRALAARAATVAAVLGE